MILVVDILGSRASHWMCLKPILHFRSTLDHYLKPSRPATEQQPWSGSNLATGQQWSSWWWPQDQRVWVVHGGGLTWWDQAPAHSPQRRPPPGPANTAPSLTRQQVRAVICATFLSELATTITHVTFIADADIQCLVWPRQIHCNLLLG